MIDRFAPALLVALLVGCAAPELADDEQTTLSDAPDAATAEPALLQIDTAPDGRPLHCAVAPDAPGSAPDSALAAPAATADPLPAWRGPGPDPALLARQVTAALDLAARHAGGQP